MSAKPVQVITPIGELNYVNISGQGKKNYNEDGYDYVASINLTGEDAQKLISAIDTELGEIPKGKIVRSRGYRELLKDEKGLFAPTSQNKDRQEDAEKTGIFSFTFKTKTKLGEEGKEEDVKIKVFNAQGKQVDLKDRKVGNGSTGAISGKMQRFESGKEVGVSLYLKSIQITKFIPYQEDAGFETQQDGWTGEDEDSDFGAAKSESEQTEPAATTKAKPKL